MLRRRAALAAVLASGVAFAQAPPAPGGAAPRTVHVSGDARVAVRPDTAIVFAGVETTGKDLARATKDAAAAMRRVLAAVADAGVAEKDVQTTRHDVQVERPWDQGRPGPITGYTISDEVRVKVRDLSRVGAVLERVTAAGSNVLRGLSFTKDDTTAERGRALADAYATARAKAEALARAAGITLGEVLSLGETAREPVVPTFRTAQVASLGGGAPVSVGEVEIQGTVEVTYAIR